jgi:hypothetical protein
MQAENLPRKKMIVFGRRVMVLTRFLRTARARARDLGAPSDRAIASRRALANGRKLR